MRKSERRPLGGWWLAVVTVPMAWGLLALDPFPTWTRAVMRTAALLGYSALFLAGLASLWMRELAQRFGRPFIRLHHTLIIIAWASMGFHVGSAIWETASLSVLVPDFSSPLMFFTLGGRPALWLFLLVTLVAVYRARIGRVWKRWHLLSYLAFVLVSLHALLLGASFQHPAARLLPATWLAAMLLAFVLRRRASR